MFVYSDLAKSKIIIELNLPSQKCRLGFLDFVRQPVQKKKQLWIKNQLYYAKNIDLVSSCPLERSLAG